MNDEKMRRDFMKKRVLAIPLAGIMLAALAVPALAREGDISEAEITKTASPQEIKVRGQHASAGSETDTVYSVDIEWGSMIFDYVSTTSKIWNPETHTYSDGTTSGRWRPTAKEDGAVLDSNAIKVTNHSNTDVTCSFDFQASQWFADDYDPVGTFENASLALATGVGKTRENADFKETKLTITSKEIESGRALDQIGTISVTIS